jgi:hypothetical protein
MKSKERVILFTRYPIPGKTKTRLIPALGPEGSCDLHRHLVHHLLRRLEPYTASSRVSLEIRFEGGSSSLMEQWLGAGLSYLPQGEGDLGLRMERAFGEAFDQGDERVVLIGSDCPTLTGKILAEALAGLHDTDIVLGPARDGGYYLIGLRKPVPGLFQNMPWGTDQVLAETRQAAERQGLKIQLLESLSDVDRPEDLSFCPDTFFSRSAPRVEMSIIIPALNEEVFLNDTLAGIPRDPDLEVIVVDGGSRDRTREAALAAGVVFVSSPPGRARQMNTGASAARGRVLLFLHADTRLPPGFRDHVGRVLSGIGVAAGAFQLALAPSLPGLKTIERLANWRSRVFQLPYGDQALFLEAALFHSLGGYAEWPMLEDLELIQRLRRYGRIAIAPLPVVSSSRRWQDEGVWKRIWKNQAVLIGYFGGVSPGRLARWYHRK